MRSIVVIPTIFASSSDESVANDLDMCAALQMTRMHVGSMICRMLVLNYIVRRVLLARITVCGEA